MDLGDLRAFVAVAEERHFGRAAERLGISLAQVSQRVRRLEDSLKTELLFRTTRSVSVTRAGEELLAEGRSLLALVTRVEEQVRQFGAGKDGILRLGAVGSVSHTLLPRLVRIVERTMPGVRLKITAGMFTSAQERALREREIDLALLRLPVRLAGLAYRLVGRDPLVLVLASDHPLAARDQVRVEDLCSEAFVTFPESSGSVVREAVLTQCARAGFIPNSLVEVGDTGTLLGLVAAGLGVALVPRSAQNLTRSGVRFVDLGVTENIDIALAWLPQSGSALVRQVLTALEQDGLFLGATRYSESDT
ncbi:LysR family transcriptional regulator [Rhodoplanes sp. TEM]|uniref:LysR family transcriptional regulator n=1 Tax=Rhodoplanes tepidamans TaxID=200616 RepID=A0ABT5JFE8_RHOTP|nr:MULTISPECIES: LysR family transcriptional regulator [Rhodoplanes]MDC7788213.1 LysR family transcriptional regulator [Rhodoplanes tepidamans]MDC7983555.1 LysR family transcriptional regulator [Rhodoplanes sp. TEM]MDQ0354202.1 DNA-binding transcriptional LysR family regulator [Rhodoplanes tepidamans]